MNTTSASITGQQREGWISRASGYYNDIARMNRFFIPEGASVLEVGCGTGWLLNEIHGSGRRVGLDKDAGLIEFATKTYPGTTFVRGDFETFRSEELFDFIIISDTLVTIYDVQHVLENAYRHLSDDGRIFISAYNSYLRPIYSIAEALGLKQPYKKDNWLTRSDILNLSDLAGLAPIKEGFRGLLPWELFGLGRFLNRFVAP